MKISDKRDFQKRIQRIRERSLKKETKHLSIRNWFFVLLLFLIGSYAFYKNNQPTVSIAVDKMNVFYIGLDNPITVAVSGVNPEKVTLESDQLEFTNRGGGHYFVKATSPGKAIIDVKIKGKETQFVEFRIKRIPDPVAMCGSSLGGNIKTEEFLRWNGIDAIIAHFNYDARCQIKSYVATYVAKEEDPVESRNTGGKYEKRTEEMLKNVKAGDFVYFDNVKCKCPGDAAARSLNSLVFRLR